METKKEITIDELAEMMQRGFVELENKFDEKLGQMENGFNEKMDLISERFWQMNKKIERIDKKFDDKFDRILTGQDQILNSLVKLETV